jgi:integrase
LGAFAGRNAARDKMLFSLGCNTGFRISELLTVKVNDIMNGDGRVRDYLYIPPENMKGGKRGRSVKLNSKTQRDLLEYVKDEKITDFLFPSSRTDAKAIDRVQAWRGLSAALENCGLGGKTIGTHSMRKTFGTRIYEYMLSLVAAGQKVDPMRATCNALGHISIANTERYLNVDQNKIDEAIENISI